MTETAKHTPGDWKIDGQFDAETSVMIVADYPGLGDVMVIEIEPQLENWSDQEIANVRLLAAAPALLRALQAIRGTLSPSSKGYRAICDAAITKAEAGA